MNGVSQWLDGSTVYGSDPCHAARLRRPGPSSHLLVMSDNKPRKELLPMTGKAPDLLMLGSLRKYFQVKIPNVDLLTANASWRGTRGSTSTRGSP